MEEQGNAPPKNVKINDQCTLNPRNVPIKRREGITWENNSDVEIFLDLPEIFDPPPSQNPLQLNYGVSDPLFISSSARPGTYQYRVGGCPPHAPRIGTIDVE